MSFRRLHTPQFKPKVHVSPGLYDGRLVHTNSGQTARE